ncbi:type I-E CRISPR-associated protein Cas5/CasD [Streptomyces globosus]|uniref:type I-E CRISPR-associated protein Cas5/CasD n=1 Tax=Streptomyces globosus TaxID=68209 RepID=UPI0015754006|nr:type I-E CRISPR-associated protein Cas5/CasD [Streptomyces globosus]
MSVLALRLAGPLQAWGSSARFARRTTETAPTKSGVIGLLAAALGRPRNADLSDLAALSFAVRIDQAGTRVRDFQTARHTDTGKAMPVSERFYLADAVFVAAVAGDDALVQDLHAAVRAPVHLPYLGRRSCPPQGPVDLEIVRAADDPAAVLREAPWQAAAWHQERHRSRPSVRLTLLAEAAPGDPHGTALRDQPLSFAPSHRRYALRTVVQTSVEVPNPRFQPGERHHATATGRRVPVPPPRHTPEAHLTQLPLHLPPDGH